jgi:hypothetical protein
MGVALSLGVTQTLVGFATIDDQKAVEIGTENLQGNLVAACAGAGADSVDGKVLLGENNQAFRAPTRQPVSSAWTMPQRRRALSRRS